KVKGMTPTVVFYRMTAPDDVAAQCRVRSDPVADAKKRGDDPMLLEYVQHSRGDLRIRSIIEGQRDPPAGCSLRRQYSPVGPEQRTSWPKPARRQQGMIGQQSTGG